jgi:hypothetical protein
MAKAQAKQHQGTEIIGLDGKVEIQYKAIRLIILLNSTLSCVEQTKIPPTLRQAQAERDFSLLN